MNNGVSSKRGGAWTGWLITISMVVIAVSAVLYSVESMGRYAGYGISGGALLMAIGLLFQARDEMKKSMRLRRLSRMLLLSSLIYMVSGGFMIEGSDAWLALFAVATVFLVYSVFATSSVEKKERREQADG